MNAPISVDMMFMCCHLVLFSYEAVYGANVCSCMCVCVCIYVCTIYTAVLYWCSLSHFHTLIHSHRLSFSSGSFACSVRHIKSSESCLYAHEQSCWYWYVKMSMADRMRTNSVAADISDTWKTRSSIQNITKKSVALEPSSYSDLSLKSVSELKKRGSNRALSH